VSVTHVIQSQYPAALTMLENGIKDCPVTLWEDAIYKNKYWYIAFHTLFHTHLYLCEDEASFKPWEKYQKVYQYFKSEDSTRMTPYSQQELLEYLEFCRSLVDERIPVTTMEGPSGLDWLPTNKLELLLYNLRHIQHHTGQLIDRLRERSNIASAWIDMKEPKQGDG
jgi:uncharacterized damage-inducible protein DinB